VAFLESIVQFWYAADEAQKTSLVTTGMSVMLGVSVAFINHRTTVRIQKSESEKMKVLREQLRWFQQYVSSRV